MTILCIIAGVGLIIDLEEDGILPCVATILIGPVLVYTFNYLIYGFGQLVDNADALRKKFCGAEDDVTTPPAKSTKAIAGPRPIKKGVLKSLEKDIKFVKEIYEDGQITRQEYEAELAKLEAKKAGLLKQQQ